ncbi:polysaccharide pyruvyl transferase family protein [Pseudoclavibacter helvolus]|uniref:polysaccharide pyruvyl transferase family protein n=1 Tax=Pseudoclavibacter helvolus TaxID=255205 RepID=UPI0024ACF39A|nr:polysaccharide pyruvyl transferase family protein [Pseudoclavibacter helvolus]
MRVLLLHGYSASNAGDGLLVTESIELIRETFPGPVAITVMAMHPDTFDLPGVRVIDAGLRRPAAIPVYLRELTRLGKYDLLVGVGGGYLRAGHFSEGVKTMMAHGPQLLAAALSRTPSVYLPQSVGPFRGGTRVIYSFLLGRLTRIYLRDDRSVTEAGVSNSVRFPDMALLTQHYEARSSASPTERPVVTVRTVRGRMSPHVKKLASLLPGFDSYVQSRGAGNDDTAAVASLGAEHELTRGEYLNPAGPRRVVVAVRLHAALMALNAGHWVMHLAYERKGFGAFDDLGLRDWVVNVNDFNADTVSAKVESLLSNEATRAAYNEQLQHARQLLGSKRAELIEQIAKLRDV